MPRWRVKAPRTRSPRPPRPPTTSQATPPPPALLIATVRDILSHTKARKKSLTINNYSECFATLDALDRLLDNNDHIEASLKAFKTDLLAELASAPFRAPSASYASAAALPPSTTSAPAPPPARAPVVKTREVTITLDKSCDLLSLPAPEIKAGVEAAIAGVEKLRGAELRGVKSLPRNRLLVAVDTDRVATLLRHSAAHWVTRLTKDSSLIVPRCQIVVNAVQLSFDPSSPLAVQHLYSRNRSVFSDPSVITEMRWLNPKVLRDPKKKASSLLVTISDAPSADRCISQGLAIESSICYPHRYEEPPLSCFNCQGYGHTQHQCKQASPTCARCSGPHRSSSCPCSTSSTKCSPGKRCEHFSPRCANCNGKHPAFHKDCPVRVEERERQRQRLRGRIFFDPNFNPYAAQDSSSAPFFFESPPSAAPPPSSTPTSPQ